VGVSAHAVVVCGEHFLSWDSFEAGILIAESTSEFREEDDVPALPIVNYSLSVEEVYKETVVACLSSSDPFTILSLAPAGGSSSLKLPSWVPDFSALPPKISGAYSYIGAGCFRAGRFLVGSKPHLEGKSQDVLSAQGKIIGNILKLKVRPGFSEDSISEDWGLYASSHQLCSNLMLTLRYFWLGHIMSGDGNPYHDSFTEHVVISHLRLTHVQLGSVLKTSVGA
jgi:hypothetical protein